MPRKAKRTTLSGEPAQPARPAVDVPYGEGERRIESQRRMPVPNRKDVTPTAPKERGTGGGGGAPVPNLMEALRDVPLDRVLAQPSQRPAQPITEGLGSRMRNVERPVVNDALYKLRAIARRYPYPGLLRLLERAERGG